jgi:maltooligosyltrehalose trehalohydrolase
MHGANPKGNQTEFSMWAPLVGHAAVRLIRSGGKLEDLPMQKRGDTFALLADASPGDRYYYLLDRDPFQSPDPVSRFLPEGVHGPTEIVNPNSFPWTDHNWRGVDYRDYVIYELHTGTFTPAGTLDSAVEKLEYLKRLGVTAIELMPVGAFPGKRNWGYDGVSIYAVQESYGGPEGLKRLVDAAHRTGLAVILDVVYNHLGNEGNYLRRFGPYFTSKHQTPWGNAINFDDKHCEGVRDYVRENALYWIREYHVDGLRMDAVHTIQDDSKTHILAEIRDSVQQYARHIGRRVSLIAETDENLPRYVLPRKEGGFGLDGIWSDDFHHALHAVVTGEREGYYQDFGAIEQIAKALNEGFVFQGEHFNYWGAPRGEASDQMPIESHVICIQNHDQVGNRALGERLTELVPLGMRKIMAALLLLAPETPLLFMGQESDEWARFQFFTDYGDPVLQKAVSQGRRNEFKDFSSFGADFPDPQDPKTFLRSKIGWELTPERREMLEWYRQLLRLRKDHYSKHPERNCCAEALGAKGIELRIPARNSKLVLRANWDGSEIKDLSSDWTRKISFQDGIHNLQVHTSMRGGQ